MYTQLLCDMQSQEISHYRLQVHRLDNDCLLVVETTPSVLLTEAKTIHQREHWKGLLVGAHTYNIKCVCFSETHTTFPRDTRNMRPNDCLAVAR